MEPYFVVDFPKLMLDWSYELNGGLKPDYISYGSDKIITWKCHKCESTWKARVRTRNKGNGTGCPVCNRNSKIGKNVYKGSVLDGNNIVEKCPELLNEWNYKKNINISPYNIKPESNLRVWWICKNCNGSWETTVQNRTRGSGCP
ncbi:MAG: zinc-ribbon domain-containing protein, partial [Lachnospiraceae bacterium]|nr:zinc-ribbon domain-containing protein [Lachnospiraceae bacterium]